MLWASSTLWHYHAEVLHFSVSCLQCTLFPQYTVPSREKGPTTEYQPIPHFGFNFLLRSKVSSNMCPYVHVYVAALEHACAIIIKWAWLRSLAVHNHSLIEAETLHRRLGLVLWPFGRLFFNHTLIIRSAVLINQPFELRLSYGCCQQYREVSAR